MTEQIRNSDSREERELTLSQSADNRALWYAATNDPIADARLRKLGAVVVRERRDASGNVTMREFELSSGMVLLRRQPEKRTVTPAQLQNLRKMQAARGITSPADV